MCAREEVDETFDRDGPEERSGEQGYIREQVRKLTR